MLNLAFLYKCLILSLSLLVIACGGSGDKSAGKINTPGGDSGQISPAPGSSTGDGTAPGSGAAVTYHGDVARILNSNCVLCHQDGGIAPFAMDSFESAARMASSIRRVTQAKTMPPFLADTSGGCQALRDPRGLTDAEIALLGQWVDQGINAGTQPPVAPPVPSPASLTAVDAVARLSEPYVPQGAVDHPQDDYRCFVVDPGVTSNQYLTAYEVRPGNRSVVHHVIAFALNTPAIEQTAMQKDAADPGPGYSCYGGSQLSFNDAPMVGGWAPGLGVTNFPRGTGILLNANRKLVLQVHYNLAAGSGTDQSEIALQFAKTPVTEANILPVAALDMVLPPGQAKVDVTADTPPLIVSYQIHGVFPHMHKLGSAIRVDKRSAAGASSCLLNIPRWDFNWQEFFFFKNPVTMSGTDTTRLTCSYDTTSRQSEVRWGEGTQDEMCLNFFYVTGLAAYL